MKTEILIDFNRDGGFDHPNSNVSAKVRDSLFFSGGWFNVGQVESNVAAHISPVNSMRFILMNEDRMFSFEYGNAELYNLLHSGLMAKLIVTHNGISHSFTYFTQSVKESVGEFGDHLVIVDCVCAMPRIQATNYEPEVKRNKTTDEALTIMLESADLLLPYTSDYFYIDVDEIDSTTSIFDPDTHVPLMIDYETGYTEMDYVGDILYRDRKGISVQKMQLFIADMCMAEAYGRFFYQPRDGKLHFHNRYHDKLQATSLTLDSGEYISGDPVTTPVFNEIRMHYQAREQGSAGSELFDSKAVPITLEADAELEIKVKFADPNDKRVPVSAITIIDPVPNSDIQVTLGGGNVAGQVYQSADLKGAGGTIYFHNQTGFAVSIDQIKVRGTPITLPEPDIAEAVSASSTVQYNKQVLPDLKGTYITDAELAQNVVNFLLERHKTMHRVLESVSMIVTDENFVDIMSVTIGDVVQIRDDWSSHDTEYVVVGEAHSYDIPRDVWRVQWFLRSNDTTPYFIIDTSAIDGSDIIGY